MCTKGLPPHEKEEMTKPNVAKCISQGSSETQSMVWGRGVPRHRKREVRFKELDHTAVERSKSKSAGQACTQEGTDTAA